MEKLKDLPARSKLVGYRKMINLTQDDMARYLDITRTTYNKKENDPKKFTYDEQLKIQDLFNAEIPDCSKVF